MTTYDIRYIENHVLYQAGDVWVIPKYPISVSPDGRECVALVHLDPIHRAIAVQICGDPRPITSLELEFLCDVVDIPFAEVARKLDISRSTISHFMRLRKTWDRPKSKTCKVFFMSILFERVPSTEPGLLIRVREALDPDVLLETSKKHMEEHSQLYGIEPGVRRLADIKKRALGLALEELHDPS